MACVADRLDDGGNYFLANKAKMFSFIKGVE
jgi:hypothetical protein